VADASRTARADGVRLGLNLDRIMGETSSPEGVQMKARDRGPRPEEALRYQRCLARNERQRPSSEPSAHFSLPLRDDINGASLPDGRVTSSASVMASPG
jgi:hypothetical protein